MWAANWDKVSKSKGQPQPVLGFPHFDTWSCRWGEDQLECFLSGGNPADFLFGSYDFLAAPLETIATFGGSKGHGGKNSVISVAFCSPAKSLTFRGLVLKTH